MPDSADAPTDVLVVGAGAAGLYAALRAARDGAEVTVISATPLAETASYWAQGGVAAALAVDDSPAAHLADTERAGRGLVRRSAAEALCREAPDAVADLEALGVRFDADRHGRLVLGLEGGHTHRRVVHAGGSATGRRLVRQLAARLVAHPRVRVLEQTRASAVWTSDGRAVGAVTEDGRAVAARATILACGGSAALWRRTTNPPGSVGVGAQLAYAAGAELADLEFVQFHPTAVAGIPGREGFLVTEAIRGEGATLLDGRGERFVEELAPRDEVAYAVWRTMRDEGSDHVLLDMRHVDAAAFPNVVAALRESGLDPETTPVPVAPACHYTMGGVACDLQGATRVPGLFVVGETACTGLHGANRLASNSLAECIVFGGRAARAALDAAPLPERLAPAPAGATVLVPARETRHALWRHAGIERDAEGLRTLLDDPHPLARAIGAAALARDESRGAHRRADHPALDHALDGVHTIVAPAADGGPPATRRERWDAAPAAA
ncbi:FAD-dependent oxidoreductase [Patulibacter sp. SYSU D01012]|uniref:L-aspartate oxidase n=1 Tax=Patulibacter sp. SYSU D01012 TaxID=2817381 RepID=UPI001B30BF3F|nr:FAD-dependent oxidoreductase [Patulibacter sp. SYSU D01012]